MNLVLDNEHSSKIIDGFLFLWTNEQLACRIKQRAWTTARPVNLSDAATDGSFVVSTV